MGGVVSKGLAANIVVREVLLMVLSVVEQGSWSLGFEGLVTRTEDWTRLNQSHNQSYRTIGPGLTTS